MTDMTLGEAAKAIGVSAHTLRRWDGQGLLQTTRDASNRRLVSNDEVARLRRCPAYQEPCGRLSAGNRFPGCVLSVEEDELTAIVRYRPALTR